MTITKDQIDMISKVSLFIDIYIFLDLNQIPRGPGYFKLNNSLLLDTSYQNNIKRTISETALINTESIP